MSIQTKQLEIIPGVGPAIARDLCDIGVMTVADLRSKNPERLYKKLMIKRGRHVDRCVLYVFREAIYFAKGGRNPEKLKWWNWKDGVIV